MAAHVPTTVKATLWEVDLSDIVMGCPKGEALTVVATVSSALEGSHLTSSNLSDNVFVENGVRTFLESWTSL
jgi:hypothetical protein